MTGATPPFSPLARFGQGGRVNPGVNPGVNIPPRLWGVAPVCRYPCYMDSSIYARVLSILEG